MRCTSKVLLFSCFVGEGKGGSLNFPLPAPSNPGSHPILFCWLLPICAFSIAKYYAMLHNSYNFPLFLRLLASSVPTSHTPPAPFSPGPHPPPQSPSIVWKGMLENSELFVFSTVSSLSSVRVAWNCIWLEPSVAVVCFTTGKQNA